MAVGFELMAGNFILLLYAAVIIGSILIWQGIKLFWYFAYLFPPAPPSRGIGIFICFAAYILFAIFWLITQSKT